MHDAGGGSEVAGGLPDLSLVRSLESGGHEVSIDVTCYVPGSGQ